MIYINEREIGLGKAKILKKIQIKKIAKPIAKAAKQISIKNAVKVAKFAGPIAAGFIPVGGGVASKLTSKVLNSKAGKVVSKIAKSKIAKKAVKLSKTQAGKIVVNQAKTIARPKIEAIKAIGAATFAKTTTPTAQANTPYTNEEQRDNAEPVGELTPVKPTATSAKAVTPISKATTPYAKEELGEDLEPEGELTPVKQTSNVSNEMQNIKVDDPDVKYTAKKDNTMLYVGGAVALGAIAYLATKKSK
jgi:hypothetical protein